MFVSGVFRFWRWFFS